MRTQTIGTEIEFTGITRNEAAKAIAKYFGTTAVYVGRTYDAWAITDTAGREWKVMSDASLRAEKKIGGEVRQASGYYRCELVTPILKWADIETLQEVVRTLRKAGAIVNETCGQHVHLGAAGMTMTAVRNLVNIFASREELFFKALGVHEGRKDYCRPAEERFLRELNEKKPATLEELGRIWYNTSHALPTMHYHSSRYRALNLHALFTKGTIEIRIFNATLHAGEVKAAIQFSAALVAFAKKARNAIYRPVNLENAKFTMRTFLTGRLGMNGEEFATARLHLTKRLEGNAAWRFAS